MAAFLGTNVLVLIKIWFLFCIVQPKNGILKQVTLSFYKMESLFRGEKLYFVHSSWNPVVKVSCKLCKKIKSDENCLELSQGTLFSITLRLNMLKFEKHVKLRFSFSRSVTTKNVAYLLNVDGVRGPLKTKCNQWNHYEEIRMFGFRRVPFLLVVFKAASS